MVFSDELTMRLVLESTNREISREMRPAWGLEGRGQRWWVSDLVFHAGAKQDQREKTVDTITNTSLER